MADTSKKKRKIFFSKGIGKVYSKDLREPIVSPGKFTKRTRGFNAKIIKNG